MAVTNKLEINVKGKVFGFQNEGEDELVAIARILLEAEQHGNDGKSRLHLEPSGTLPVSGYAARDDAHTITETYVRVSGGEDDKRTDRCPWCQAKIDVDGSHWRTPYGTFCDKDHFNKWHDAQSQEERIQS